MGAFFTNVQVRGGDPAAIARAIREDAQRRGMDEVGEVDKGGEDGAPDRSVLVLPPDEGGWIAIYDQATEGQDRESLAAIAAAASRAAASGAGGGYALTVTIHDSDVLYLELFRDGERIDRLDSNPGYFGGRGPSKKKRAELAGDPAKWKELGDPDALREAWSAEELFAERTLRRTCEIVGCDVRRASTGYRYTTHDGDELPEGTLVLRFRDRVRPPWESGSDEPPALETESYVEGEIPLGVGDELRVSLGARSAGRASTGLGVRCWGSAIEKRLVAVERFEVLIGNPLAGARHLSVTPEITRSIEGEHLLAADLPELEIPSGSAEPFAGFRPGMDFLRAMEAMQRSKVHVNVVGRVIAAGKGELGIGLVPLENPEASAGTIAMLAIDPPFARPLRAQLREGEQSSHLLRPLAGDRYLVGMIAIDAPRAELARRAREVLEIVRGEIAEDDPVTTAIFFGDARRPKTGRGKAKTMLRGKRQDDLLAAIGTEQVVTISAGPVALEAGTSMIRNREEERVPWLALSVDAEGRELAAIRDRLSALWDEIVRAHPGQAFLARTGWPAGSIDATPYEQACGIAHGIGTVARWCERWVRVPGNDRLWIPRSMMERVDRAALEAIAELEEVGGTTRITLRDRSDGSRLEHAIAELLPTAEESQRSALAFHRAG